MTTGVYVLLNCVCDIKNRIRERTRAVTPLAVSFFLLLLCPAQQLMSDLLSREEAEVGGQSPLVNQDAG